MMNEVAPRGQGGMPLALRLTDGLGSAPRGEGEAGFGCCAARHQGLQPQPRRSSMAAPCAMTTAGAMPNCWWSCFWWCEGIAKTAGQASQVIDGGEGHLAEP